MSLSVNGIQAVSLGARLSDCLETPTQDGKMLLSADLGETKPLPASPKMQTIQELRRVNLQLPPSPMGPALGPHGEKADG